MIGHYEHQFCFFYLVFLNNSIFTIGHCLFLFINLYQPIKVHLQFGDGKDTPFKTF